MPKKIILLVVLLIFAQQDFYGMDNRLSWLFDNLEPISAQEIQENRETRINYHYYLKKSCYINHNYRGNISTAPLFWPLWAFLDNVLFQFGGSKIWKHGEAYYGLSNGIGFFPSFLNFGWLKIGIGDAHINVITFILNYIRISVAGKVRYYARVVDKINKLGVGPDLLPLTEYRCYFYRDICFSLIMTGIHLLSFNFLNCIKIKIISLVGCLAVYYGLEEFIVGNLNKRWYFAFYIHDLEELVRFENTNGLYLLLAPRIEINIAGIIKYFRGKKFLHTRHRRTI